MSHKPSIWQGYCKVCEKPRGAILTGVTVSVAKCSSCGNVVALSPLNGVIPKPSDDKPKKTKEGRDK